MSFLSYLSNVYGNHMELNDIECGVALIPIDHIHIITDYVIILAGTSSHHQVHSLIKIIPQNKMTCMLSLVTRIFNSSSIVSQYTIYHINAMNSKH